MRQLLIAITFLTTIPLPIPKGITPREQGEAIAFFPIVGLVLGGILAGIDRIAGTIWTWSSLGKNSLLVVIMVLLTGGLHLDGLMDTCDGIFSHRSKERMLEIMKDSHVGAFGAIGAICILLMKFAFLNEINGSQRWQSLLIVPILGRWAMSFAISIFPYARKEEGLGHSFKSYAHKKYLLYATLITLLLSILILSNLSGYKIFIFAALSTMGFSVLVAWKISRQLGGLTGDTYGAICESSETIALIMLAWSQTTA